MSRFQLYIVTGFALILATAVPAAAGMNGTEWLQSMEQARPRQPEGRPAQSDSAWVRVKLKGVDRAGQRLTISHGALRKVGMPAMTMTFPAGNRPHLAMLQKQNTITIHVANRGGVIQIVDFHMSH
jgi:Cu/Ag efflux protein CusF